jgi:HlyD family secretion protein
MKRKVILGIVILAVAAALIYYFFIYRVGLNGQEIRTSGHIEVTEVDMSFRIPGHVARLLVEEGDQVSPGALLAELKQEIIQAKYDQAAAQLAEIQARQESLALVISIKEEVTAADVARAEATVSAAEARYDSLKTGSRKEEIREAAAALEKARTEMLNRERDYKRMANLYERHIISASQYEDSRTAAQAAKAGYQAVLAQYQLVKAGPRDEAVSEGQANVSGSGAALDATRAGTREVDKLELDLKALNAQADQVRAALAIAADDLKESRLLAPFNGFITVKDVEQGEFVQAGSPVVTLAQLDRVWVKTYVPETQLGRVRLSQAVEVISDSYPGKIYQGRVTYISPEAEFTPKNVQTKEERIKLVYRIKVSLDNPNQELKAGMPVDVVLR